MIKIIIINIIITLVIVFYIKPKCEHFDLETLNAAKEICKKIFLTDGKIVIPQDIIIDGKVEITKSLKVKKKLIN